MCSSLRALLRKQMLSDSSRRKITQTKTVLKSSVLIGRPISTSYDSSSALFGPPVSTSYDSSSATVHWTLSWPGFSITTIPGRQSTSTHNSPSPTSSASVTTKTSAKSQPDPLPVQRSTRAPAVAGAVVPSVLLVAVLACIALFWIRNRRKRSSTNAIPDSSHPNVDNSPQTSSSSPASAELPVVQSKVLHRLPTEMMTPKYYSNPKTVIGCGYNHSCSGGTGREAERCPNNAALTLQSMEPDLRWQETSGPKSPRSQIDTYFGIDHRSPGFSMRITLRPDFTYREALGIKSTVRETAGNEVAEILPEVYLARPIPFDSELPVAGLPECDPNTACLSSSRPVCLRAHGSQDIQGAFELQETQERNVEREQASRGEANVQPAEKPSDAKGKALYTQESRNDDAVGTDGESLCGNLSAGQDPWLPLMRFVAIVDSTCARLSAGHMLRY